MKSNYLIAAAMAVATTSAVQAQQVEVTITNLTQGIYYTPLIVAAHTSDASLFMTGQQASEELQAMAEGGDISGLSSILQNASADVVENPAGGLLAPAMSATAMLDTTEGNMYLSIAGMMLPTNDGFVGVNSWMIPSEAGTYTFTMNAYDAGTEANDEIRGGGAPNTPGMPVPPPLESMIGMSGTGVTSMENNQMIHIHRGNLGDDDMASGKSDINNMVHRWLNPVAKVTVTVN